MKSFQKSIWLVIPIFLLLPFTVICQTVEPEGKSDIELLNAAREIMTAASTCALITLDEQVLPRVRAMDPFIPESDFTVWFGTNPNSSKVNQIRKNPGVTLYYLDRDDSGYVVIHGTALLVDDQKEKERRWKAEWESFYPNRTDGYLLIKVSPEWMEVISYAHGIVGDPKTWKTPVVYFNSKK